MRCKIAGKIKEIIKKEEQAARKIIDDDEMQQIVNDNSYDFLEGDLKGNIEEVGVKELNQTPADLKSPSSQNEDTERSKILPNADEVIQQKK